MHFLAVFIVQSGSFTGLRFQRRYQRKQLQTRGIELDLPSLDIEPV
jgi:hypothetical protein